MTAANASLPAPVLDQLFDVLRSDCQLGAGTETPHAACREIAGILEYLFDASEIDRFEGQVSTADTAPDGLLETHAVLVCFPCDVYRPGSRQFFNAAGPQIL